MSEPDAESNDFADLWVVVVNGYPKKVSISDAGESNRQSSTKQHIVQPFEPHFLRTSLKHYCKSYHQISGGCAEQILSFRRAFT